MTASFAGIVCERRPSVSRWSILFGSLLVALGAGAFFYSSAGADKPPYTALIPAGFGLPLILLGVVALKDNLRKHAMHVAAMVGLIGFLGGAVMLLLPVLRGTEIARPFAYGCQAVMAALCLAFVGLCVHSFVDARRRRALGS